MEQGQTPVVEDRSRYHIVLATVVVQVGCLTPLIILAAIFLGRWLDSYFNSGRTFTIVIIVASIPVCLILMFALVKLTIAKMLPAQVVAQKTEEDHERRTS